MFGGEQLDEASLRAMREKYFGSEEHFNQLVAEGKFKSGNSEYSQVFARMVGEGREVMEVAGLMVQMGNMMTPGVVEEVRRLRETNPQLYAMVGGVQPLPTADSSFFYECATQVSDMEQLLEQLRESPGIEIHSLTSPSGSKLNGAIGYFADGHGYIEILEQLQGLTTVSTDTRVHIVIDRPCTGEQKIIKAKLKNLRPSQTPPPRNDPKPYTTTGLLRENHGRMVDFALSVGRYESNNIGCFYEPFVDDLDGIMAMDRSRPEMAQMMNFMWTHWDLAPSEAGYKGAAHGFNVYELITYLLQHNEPMHVQQSKEKDARGNPMGDKRIDGKRGELLHPNFIKSVRNWGKERLPGYYWVVRDTPSGTLMCSEDLTKVYLVKGIVDKIGNVAARGGNGALPKLLYTTIVPIFQYLTYAGQLQYFAQKQADYKEANLTAIKELVEEAVAAGTVITCSAFAMSGAWDTNTKKEIPMVCIVCGIQRDKDKGVKLLRCSCRKVYYCSKVTTLQTTITNNYYKQLTTITTTNFNLHQGYEQQDAHEFLLTVLSAVHEDTNRRDPTTKTTTTGKCNHL